MLNQIFPRLSTKIFCILHKLDENNHLNSSYHFLLSDAQPDFSGIFSHIAQARWGIYA